MVSSFEEGVEDVPAAIAAGRPVRGRGPYGILVGDADLNFSPAIVADPVPTGAQILAAAGLGPVGFLLYGVLDDGLLEEVRPEETIDLRSSGAERFLVFRSDRSFRIQLDDRAYDWGASRISGATLKRLAGKDIQDHDVWLAVRGGTDRLIGNRDMASLAGPEVERFFTARVTIRIIVNARERRLDHRVVSYWELVTLAFPDAVPSENIIYSVTFSSGPAQNPEGSLVEGQSVHITDGMAFSVTPTDRS
ncbi:MAG: hypothetical protein ABS36_05240 [Acidobacteria bacterium SCN 69-37]|nr:MAG: hypothetical protein ABS36_05240 [Acidobacteria bacterium SCN 69-37]